MENLKNKTRYSAGLLLGAALFSLAFVSCGSNDDEAVVNPAELEGWTLTWQDEFDKPTIDPLKWKVTSRPKEESHNNELQDYLISEVYIQDGCLRLRSQKTGPNKYISGHVTTLGKFAQTYGRFEVRARLPKTKGIWPAHWMLPVRDAWPPEIDIMELLGHDPNTVYMTNHWGTSSADHYWNSKGYTGPDFSADFHTFAVEWDSEKIVWYVDGVMRYVSANGVPHEPFYIILNTAVGGDWPGNPDETTVFPQYHDIDYVRVYTKNQ
jgi:beta-glucanase (GH16 family)